MAVTGRKKQLRNGARPKEWEPSTRDLEIYRMLSEGKLTQTEIAGQFRGVGRSRVSQIGKRIDQWLAPQLINSIREIKARHTQHLLVIFREAMNARDRSKEGDRTVSATSSSDNGNSHTVTQKTTTGNPTYLGEARRALAEIRQIWGADAPIEVRHGLEVRVAGRPIEEAAQMVLDQMEVVKARVIGVSEKNK